jgi:uncharacterized paraquat-inducible protein A
MLGSVLTTVFKKSHYVQAAALTAVVVFTLALWLPNISFVLTYLTSGATLWQKLQFIWSFYGSIQTNHTFYSATLSFAIAFLSGINIALLVYYTRRVRSATSGLKLTHTGSYLGLWLGDSYRHPSYHRCRWATFYSTVSG